MTQYKIYVDGNYIETIEVSSKLTAYQIGNVRSAWAADKNISAVGVLVR